MQFCNFAVKYDNMYRSVYSVLSGAFLSIILSCSCTGRSGTAGTAVTAEKPAALLLGAFNADSAYNFISRQVAFGPRVPGTESHERCAEYLIGELKRIGVDTMYVQRGKVTAFNGDVLPITNIIAGFNSTSLKRVLLVAHWDTRPWADNETDPEKRNTPIPGANDGASGVGVILEIARNLSHTPANIGVDILLVDAEDYGDSSFFEDTTESWCLGSQYWVENMVPYSIRNLPGYGILLDMVGGKGARFHQESFSRQNASDATIKIWNEAKKLGHDNVFIDAMGGAITDDHIFLTHAGIPTVDIIESVNHITGSFPPTWHTLSDDMSGISRSTLKAVGETVLNVIYKEKGY